MRKVYLTFIFICVVATLTCGGKIQPTLTLEKTEFAPGEEIELTFTAPASYGENAWVGIVPSSVEHGDEVVNDQHDISYEYMKKRTSGKMKFTSPSKPGAYDFRMNDADDKGKEVASLSFEVKLVTEGAVLTLDKTSYKPGEEIRLAFTAPDVWASNAWIGIIPSDVPHGSEEENDRHDLGYQYLSKKTQGLLLFKAPEKLGKYDLRMHDTDNKGNEITYVEFSVEQ